jgi:hypothetical protein
MVLDIGHNTELDSFLAAARKKDDGERRDEDSPFSAHGRRFCGLYSNILALRLVENIPMDLAMLCLPKIADRKMSSRGAEAASLAWREAWRPHADFDLMRSLPMLGTAQGAGLPRPLRGLAMTRKSTTSVSIGNLWGLVSH